MTDYKLWVDHAVQVAMQSPCQSKRGVVIWNGTPRWISDGFNNQPAPFRCDGTERCKKTCGKTAVHAEQSAIVKAEESLTESSMLHAKASIGIPCASVAPSCLECSKLILAAGIRWMHLLHDPVRSLLPGAEVVGRIGGFGLDDNIALLQVCRYSAEDFHRLTAEQSHGYNLVRIEA